MNSTEFDLSSYLNKWTPMVEERLFQLWGGEVQGPAAGLYAAMRYSLFAGGKRLRPVLCLAGCEAVEGKPGQAVNMACALEMIHTYSLIHDDLPALDDDDFRRGQPTCHKKFGEAIAILAGDALLTEAFAVIAQDSALPPELRLRLIADLAQAAGINGMVAGQAADMEKEGSAFTEPDVIFIHGHKTAALITVSVTSGGRIGGGAPAQVDALRNFGQALGLAFQISDDVLNVTGGKELGKGVGTDAERGKATYPALFGVEASRRRVHDLCDQAVSALSGFGQNAGALRAIAGWLKERKH